MLILKYYRHTIDLIKISETVKKECSLQKSIVKKDVISKVAAKKWL